MERGKPTSIVGTLVFLGSCCRSSVANPARQSEATEEDTNVDAHTATPVCYISLYGTYSATTPCLTAKGSSALMSKKIKARKLPYVTNQSDGTKIEINRVDDHLCNGDNKGYNSGTSNFKGFLAIGCRLVHRQCSEVKYEGGDKEDIVLANEKIKFYLSPNEMRHLNLKHNVKSMDSYACDYEEMVIRIFHEITANCSKSLSG